MICLCISMENDAFKKKIHFLRGVWYNEMSVSFGQVFAGKDIGKLWKRK